MWNDSVFWQVALGVTFVEALLGWFHAAVVWPQLNQIKYSWRRFVEGTLQAVLTSVPLLIGCLILGNREYSAWALGVAWFVGPLPFMFCGAMAYMIRQGRIEAAEEEINAQD